MSRILASAVVLTIGRMMRILVIGAGGMLGAKLIARLVQHVALDGRKIDHLTRVDAVSCAPIVADFTIETIACDI